MRVLVLASGLLVLASSPVCAADRVRHDAMVAIPAGPFTMGRNDGPDDERPAHNVHPGSFSIDRLPVTNADFAEFLNAVRLSSKSKERTFDHDDADARIRLVREIWTADQGYERHPVVEVPWTGARDYCAWRGKRLPTEAEWEKAARGTDGRRYPWGNDPPDATRARYGMRYNETAPVDGRRPGASPYGVLDMAGNVWEWVSSAYRPYPYRADDGREDLTAGPVRGTRGGGHDSGSGDITTTQRGRNLSRNPASGHHNIGFRCAMSEEMR